MSSWTSVLLQDDLNAVRVLAEGSVAGLPADRVSQMPVGARALAAVATGLARVGQRVVVCLSGSAQLPEVAAALAGATLSAAPNAVVLVPYDADGRDGPLDASVSLSMGRVVVARDAGVSGDLLRTCLQSRGVSVLCVPRASAPVDAPAPSGLASQTVHAPADGAHVVLAAMGPGVAHGVHVAQALAGEGIGVQVIDMVHDAPDSTLIAAIQQVGRVVFVADGLTVPAAQLASAVGHAAFWNFEAPPVLVPAHEALATVRASALDRLE